MNTTTSSNAPSTPSTSPLSPLPDQFEPQLDATTRLSGNGRALVLGGGGSTGNAWLIGVVAGLYDAGVDVTAPDVTIGTSAGSTAAAQMAGASPTELYAATLAPVPAALKRSGPVGSGAGGKRPVVDHLARIRGIISSAGDVAEMRRRIGASLVELDAGSDGSWQTQWRTTVASRLPSQRWPMRPLLITAVDANSGEPVVFDRHSGVELVDAVAASCSSGRPYRIGDGSYIDGGYRSNAENADLARGFGRVLVLSPFGGRSLQPVEWGTHLATQVKELRASGSIVETIFPASDSEHMFGANAMDLSLRPAAAQAGYDRGTVLAGKITDFWR